MEQEKADGVLEENLTRKVKQMLHEEKAAAIKRLMKKGQLLTELTEVDEGGNRLPTKEALISGKKLTLVPILVGVYFVRTGVVMNLEGYL